MISHLIWTSLKLNPPAGITISSITLWDNLLKIQGKESTYVMVKKYL